MRIFPWFSFAILGGIASAAEANGVPPLPLQTQFLRADLITVSRLSAHTTCLVAGGRYPCAEMRTDVVLKGAQETAGVRRYLILNAGVNELSVENVAIPARAIFFLNRINVSGQDQSSVSIEFYRVVHGRQSILQLEDSD